MQSLVEQNSEEKDNLYLESPKTFHLEMPLYYNFDLSKHKISSEIFKLLRYSGTMDAYCIWCKKEGVFKAYKNIHSSFSFLHWTKELNGLIEIEYHCARNHGHAYHTYYYKDDKFFTKVGQYPSVADFQIPQAENYRKILGEEQYKEFARGIGLSAHGVGIGSFVYLRRIFENLIENAHVKAQSEIEDFANDVYVKARMDEKIKIIEDYLPKFLVENRTLYAILSKGIHDLNEDECLKYFDTVKIGIEQILDEKIIQKEKFSKAAKAREAIQKLHGEITKS